MGFVKIYYTWYFTGIIKMYSFFRKRLSENEARRYINQMTSAIHYMHKQNIMHRDIKLENAVLQSGGRVFIVGT